MRAKMAVIRASNAAGMRTRVSRPKGRVWGAAIGAPRVVSNDIGYHSN